MIVRLTLEDVVELNLVILTSLYLTTSIVRNPCLFPPLRSSNLHQIVLIWLFPVCLPPCFVDLVIENGKFHTEEFLFFSGLRSLKN